MSRFPILYSAPVLRGNSYSRFEEMANGDAASKKTLKRAADAMDEDAPADDGGLSKKQKKKNAKKLKNAEGDAVATSVASAASPDSKKKEKKAKDKKEKSDTEGEKEGKKDSKVHTTVDLPGGLTYIDAKKGDGKPAKKGNTLSMRYIGKLESGKVFDKNTSGAPVSMRFCGGRLFADMTIHSSSASALVKEK